MNFRISTAAGSMIVGFLHHSVNTHAR